MISMTPELFLRLAPEPKKTSSPAVLAAHLAYRKAFAFADSVLARYEINATPLRLAHWFAQMAHESGGFRLLEESLTYTTAARICAVWPTRFNTLAAATPYLRNPAKLAEKVYGGRNGNTRPGDGFRYRGRAVPMLTFRSNYSETGARLGLDLEGDPDLVLRPENILLIAADFWAQKGCNALADADTFTGTDQTRNPALITITKKINGGRIGLDDRAKWLTKVLAVLRPAVIVQPKRARVEASALNLRREASSSSKIIRTLDRDTIVTVLDVSEWSRVQLSTGETGFVASRFLKALP